MCLSFAQLEGSTHPETWTASMIAFLAHLASTVTQMVERRLQVTVLPDITARLEARRLHLRVMRTLQKSVTLTSSMVTLQALALELQAQELWVHAHSAITVMREQPTQSPAQLEPTEMLLGVKILVHAQTAMPATMERRLA